MRHVLATQARVCGPGRTGRTEPSRIRIRGIRATGLLIYSYTKWVVLKQLEHLVITWGHLLPFFLQIEQKWLSVTWPSPHSKHLGSLLQIESKCLYPAHLVHYAILEIIWYFTTLAEIPAIRSLFLIALLAWISVGNATTTKPAR
jgi:hypothetical protein